MSSLSLEQIEKLGKRARGSTFQKGESIMCKHSQIRKHDKLEELAEVHSDEEGK